MLLLTLFVVVVSLCYWSYRATRHDYWIKRRVPSAPDPHWLFGHYKEMFMGTKFIGHIFQDIYNAFPEEPYVGFMRLFTPGLAIRDPDLVKSILTTDYSYFSKNDMTIDKKDDCLFGNSPFMQAGEEWKTSRGQLTPLVTYVKLKNYLPPMRAIGRRLVAHVRDACLQNGGDVAEFETKELATKYSADAVANAVLGIENDSFANPNSLVAGIAKDLFTGSMIDHVKTMLAFILPDFRRLIGLRFSSKKAEEILLKVTHDMMSRTTERNDLFQQMKLFRERDKMGEVSDQIIASHCYGFIFDGCETSSSVLSFVLSELAWHSDVQERLRKEIMDMVSRTKGEYTVDDIENLNYLHMVLSEIFRLHPPVGVLFKLCTTDYLTSQQNGGEQLLIKKGTTIAIPIHGLHTDAKYFPNPEKFDPERFADEAVSERHKYVFLPFGDGLRRCIGQRYAYLQTKLAVIELMTYFRLKPSSKSNYPPEIDPTIWIIRPLHGAWIHFEILKTKK